MNVLIFVMTMLMLLSLLTYARFETYRTSQVFQLFFNQYMEQDERGYINVGMDKQYKKTKGSSKDGKGEGQEKIDANRRLSLALLVDKAQREKKEKDWIQTRILLKNLMMVLYQDQPFFQKAVQERPQIVDELINELVQAVDALPKKKKIKKTQELANLSLADKSLNELFYKMLHGAPYKEVIKEEPVPALAPPEESNVELDQDDQAMEEEAKEFKSPKGYFSLLDFVNLSPTLKIRIYLAPKEVLSAIFPDKAVVEEIIQQRTALYKQALADHDTKPLKENFQNQFESRRAPEIDKSVLEFSITKSNPNSD